MNIITDDKEEIRTKFYRFLSELLYIQNLYKLTSETNNTRLLELSSVLKENKDLSYSKFIELKGQSFLDEYDHRELFFTHLFLHSIFIFVYALFENHFIEIVEIIEKGSELKIKDLSKKTKGDLDKAREYLYNTHKINNAQNINSNWVRIKKFQKIRNSIIHNNSKLIRHKKECCIFLNSYNTIIDNDQNRFYIRNDAFLNDFINLVTNYVKSIVDETSPVNKVNHLIN